MASRTPLTSGTNRFDVRMSTRMRGGNGATAPSARAIVPFDCMASFALTGRVGNSIEAVINVGAEGVFVATGISYGLDEDRARPVALQIAANGPSIVPRDLLLQDIPSLALIEGFRVNPRYRAELRDGTVVPRARYLAPVAPGDDTVFERLVPPTPVSFLYGIVDSASGRELQDEMTHNIASLGKHDGERPFRQLATPLPFAPRSTVRLQVIERTPDVRGMLQIVLHGYRILGANMCPEPVARLLATGGAPTSDGFSAGVDGARVVPFDYVSRIVLRGEPGEHRHDEIVINNDGKFVATAIGYGLDVDDTNVALLEGINRIPAALRPMNNRRVVLREVPLSAFPPDALLDGIRLRPSIARACMTAGGNLTAMLDADLADRAFERVNTPSDVSFRYTLVDGGGRRELQNRVGIHNVAGLGIANGRRPFKRLAHPLLFEPRSNIRIDVEERFGRGQLYIVFQGYKVLGTPSGNGAR